MEANKYICQMSPKNSEIIVKRNDLDFSRKLMLCSLRNDETNIELSRRPLLLTTATFQEIQCELWCQLKTAAQSQPLALFSNENPEIRQNLASTYLKQNKQNCDRQRKQSKGKCNLAQCSWCSATLMTI